jgi:hypothetical protein
MPFNIARQSIKVKATPFLRNGLREMGWFPQSRTCPGWGAVSRRRSSDRLDAVFRAICAGVPGSAVKLYGEVRQRRKVVGGSCLEISVDRAGFSRQIPDDLSPLR